MEAIHGGPTAARRRTDKSTTIGRGPTASSATCRTYRLCSRSEDRSHPGHTTATPARVRAVIRISAVPTSTASTCTAANCGNKTCTSMSHDTSLYQRCCRV